MTFTETFGGALISPAQPSFADYTTATANLSLSWPLETAPSNNVVAAINDVAFPTTGYTVTLAAASQVSPGIAPLFTNRGTDAYTVLGATGLTILTATAGSAYYAYLVSGGSTSGSWHAYQLGGGGSGASASALAGYGLVAITTTLNQQYQATTTAVTPTTIGVTARASLRTWTGGAGIFNITAAATLGNGWFFNVYNNGTGALSLTPAAGETINGTTAAFTMNPGDSCILVCDGVSAFYTIGFGQNATFAFDYTTIDVSGTGNYVLSGTELNRIAYKFTGILTGVRTIIVPSTVQQYWVDNSTTGAFTFGVATITQAVAVPIGNGSTREILYCNGTDVVLAETRGLSTPVPILQGGTGATTATGAQVNLDVPSNLTAFTYALIAG